MEDTLSVTFVFTKHNQNMSNCYLTRHFLNFQVEK